MKRKQSYVRNTLVGAQRFFNAHPEEFEAVNASGARKALDDAIDAMTRNGVAQVEHTIRATGETLKQRRIRLELNRQYLRPIVKLAAATLGEVPELSTLRINAMRLSATQLVHAASAIANAVEPHADTFIAAGLRPAFLAELRARTQELRDSLGQRTDHVNTRRGSTLALATETANARRVLQMLDAVVQQSVTDENLLAEWAAVRRIPRKPGPSRGASEAESTGSSPQVLALPTAN